MTRAEVIEHLKKNNGHAYFKVNDGGGVEYIGAVLDDVGETTLKGGLNGYEYIRPFEVLEPATKEQYNKHADIQAGFVASVLSNNWD